ncbi:hypothetical protein NP493_1020g00000 [Ridgeia piscesae]|uniref:Uncharacterized protein n=1 Tax=Ridgeia piscesae TaxID=27915 RepID=A0AAD9NJ08_RIDPI|nr:hypothetical protein NP493_1020g00000 [Ridgeia piscesae]
MSRRSSLVRVPQPERWSVPTRDSSGTTNSSQDVPPPEGALRELGRINVGIVPAAPAASSYRGGPRFGGMARSSAIHQPVSVSGAAMKTCTWRGERAAAGWPPAARTVPRRVYVVTTGSG